MKTKQLSGGLESFSDRFNLQNNFIRKWCQFISLLLLYQITARSRSFFLITNLAFCLLIYVLVYIIVNVILSFL